MQPIGAQLFQKGRVHTEVVQGCLLENLTNDAILHVMKCLTISLYLTKIYVT